MDSGPPAAVAAPMLCDMATKRTSNRSRKSNNSRREQFVFMGESQDAQELSDWTAPIFDKPDDVKRLLCQSLQSHFLFAQVRSEDLNTIASAMQLVLVQPDELVIRQGDPGDNFYVVESGQFQIFVNGRFVGEVGPGGSFGELSLMQNCARAASLKNTSPEPARTWALDRQTFRRSIAKLNSSRDRELRQTLKQCELFKTFNDGAMNTLAKAVAITEFANDEKIISKGDEGHEMFIIKSGQVVCDVEDELDQEARAKLRKHTGSPLALSALPEHEEDDMRSDGSGSVGSTTDRRGTASRRKSGVCSVTLGPGMWFGERALINKERRAASVYAAGPVVAYVLSRHIFELLLGSHAEVVRKFEDEVKLLLLEEWLGEEHIRSLGDSRSVALSLVEEDTIMPGSTVISPTEPATAFYVIKAGRAVMVSDDGDEITLGKGQCFGERALLQGREETVPSDEEVEEGGGGAAGPPADRPTRPVQYDITVKVPGQSSWERLEVYKLDRDKLNAAGVPEWAFFDEDVLDQIAENRELSTASASPIPLRPQLTAKTTAPPPPPVEHRGSSTALYPSSVQDKALSSPPEPRDTKVEGQPEPSAAVTPLLPALTAAELSPSERADEVATAPAPVPDQPSAVEEEGPPAPKTRPAVAAESQVEGEDRQMEAVGTASDGAVKEDVKDDAEEQGEVTDAEEGEGQAVTPRNRSSTMSEWLGRSSSMTFEEHVSQSKKTLVVNNGTADLEVMRTLGCGSFGRVKLALHKETNTILALKILLKSNVVEMRQVQNIKREKDIIAQLTHPNVLRLFGTFQDADSLYMMLELVVGGELFRIMHGDGSEENVLPLESARFYTAQVVEVFSYIHSQSIIYRDLKPENLLVTDAGYLKVIDWGFAKEVQDDTTYTLCGTPEYLAPELVDGRGHGKAVDFWALGCVLYEMCIGFSPFVGDDANDSMAICHRITSGIIEWPEDIECDPYAKSMIERLLCQNAVERLGCLKNGVDDIKNYPLYHGFEWEKMTSFEMPAPWVPEIQDERDVSNFDDIYDDGTEEEEFVSYDGDVTFDF